MDSIVELYETQFDPEEYLDLYYSAVDPEVEFFLRNLHEALDELKPASENVLEIGCGPTITSVLSATRWSSNVYMTDFLEKNLTSLKSTLSNSDKLSRWKSYIGKVAEFENNSAEVIRERLKRNVAHIGKCDVFAPKPALDIDIYFNVVISTLCLEFVAITEETYVEALKNIKNVMNSGGTLIIQGALNNTYYDINSRRFPSLRLDEASLRDYLGRAGFKIEEFKSIPRLCPQEDKKADHGGCFYLLAKKS